MYNYVTHFELQHCSDMLLPPSLEVRPRPGLGWGCFESLYMESMGLVHIVFMKIIGSQYIVIGRAIVT